MQSYGKKQHELGFLQVTPTPTKAELEKYYKETYYQDCPADTYSKTYSEEELVYISNSAALAERIFADYSDKKNATLFDIGCGEGFFANYFLKKGWKVNACDFSSYGVESLNPELLEHFQRGDIFDVLDDKISENKKYDFINFSNVLEHVIDPVLSINKIKKIMDRNSLLKVNVPNDFSEFQKLLIDRKFIDKETWFCAPDHLNYFTFESLEKLLDSLGFEIVKKQADFPIEIYLVNEFSNYFKKKVVGKQAHLSRLTIDNFWVEQGLDKYINYMQSAAELGFSRSVIIYAKIK